MASYEGSTGGAALGGVWPVEMLKQRFDEHLSRCLEAGEERNIDARWSRSLEQARRFALRPAKRMRPFLALAGYSAWSPQGARCEEVPEAVWQFAAGLELLHTFLLIHDDVADRATSRRGGPALHHLLGGGPLGGDLAVVLGDRLFAYAVEVMLSSGLPQAPAAVRLLMTACRMTAAGQFLDLTLSQTPLSEVDVWNILKIANLKTAYYSFAAPLRLGALLAGAPAAAQEVIEQAGRNLGVAFQLCDDLIGLLGTEEVCGKSTESDYLEGKRTFPLMAAFYQADARGKERLRGLWEKADKNCADAKEARELVVQWRGDEVCRCVINRTTRKAVRLLNTLPDGMAKDWLIGVSGRLVTRTV